ncbi:MAG: hypothetical protein NTX61_13770 [Bacteroidetes bacterium]|nr:hypothetical protein [Bacteroidota bacterium]
MKKLFHPLFFIITVILLFSFPGNEVIAQPGKFGKPANPVIVFSYNPGIKRFIPIIREKKILVFSTDKDPVLQKGRVTRIISDSIYINYTGYRMKDFSFIGFSPFIHHIPDSSELERNNDLQRKVYLRKDSSSWKIIYPPDSIYRGHFSYTGYLHHMNHLIKKEKFQKFNPLVFDNFLKINISKLFHCELALSYEVLLSEKITWEMEAGIEIGIPGADASYFINYPLWNYSGFSFLTYPKFYIISPWSYLSCVILYKYLYFNGVRTGFLGDGADGGDLQDQYRSDYGLSIRVGTMKRFGNVVLDLYAGLGCKYIWVNQIIYGSYYYHDESTIHWYNPDHTPKKEGKGMYMPIVNLGVSLGLGFN